MERIEATVGYREVYDNGEIRYYPDMTDDGECYKDDNAFESGVGVAYIREEIFSDVYADHKREYVLASELEGDIFTRSDMLDWLMNIIDIADIPPRINRKSFLEHVASCIYYELSWQGFDMLLDDTDYKEYFDDFSDQDE